MMEKSMQQSLPHEDRNLLALPAEIRIAILEYVFNDNSPHDGFKNHDDPRGIILDESYCANSYLQALLTCRQLYEDGDVLALSRAHFLCTNLFFNVPQHLARLHMKQAEAIRNVGFVADARHFRKLIDWGEHPFGMPCLHLDTLTIVLHGAGVHYMNDFTSDIVKLLRQLEGVKRFIFVRNNARVKGSFKTWFNRLVGLILKTDHLARYETRPPNPEKIWWRWSSDDTAQSFCLEALPSKEMVDEETYMRQIMPLMEELRVSVENEEWNPDPRSWNGT